MGRHSTHQQSDFFRSAFMWFLPWLLAAVVGIGALWIGIDAAFGGDAGSPADEQPSRVAAAADPTESPDESPSGAEASPTPDGSEGAVGERSKKKKKRDPKLEGKGVSIQLLNGTSLTDADDRVARDLEELGFEVVASNTWHATPGSVVYWSTPEDEKTAMLLAEEFGWDAQPKPSDLSSEVNLHVLVGADATD